MTKEEFKTMLIDNLSVSCSIDLVHDYYDNFHKVSIEIYFDNELISISSDTLPSK